MFNSDESGSFLNATLDLAVRTRKTAYPEFVSAYFLARKLHDGSNNSGTGDGPHPKEVAAMPSSEDLQRALTPIAAQPALNGVH